MNAKHSLAALIVAAFGVAQAHAIPIVFDDPTPPNIGSNGMTSTNFTLDESTQDISSAVIQFDLGEVDEGIQVMINGTTLFDIPRMDTNSGGPVGITPGLNGPWSDDGSRPRAIFTISETDISVVGLINANDGAYTPLTITAAVTMPTFIDGVNEIKITNNNVSGPGGSRNMALSGTVQPPPVPEPATAALGLIGLAGLAGATMRRRQA